MSKTYHSVPSQNASGSAKSSPARKASLRQCGVCGGDFRSHSHFDIICNLCWADNEMRPYYRFGRMISRGGA